MEKKAYQVAIPATLVLVIVSVLFTIFFVNVILSFATSDKKKSSTVVGNNAAGQTQAQEELWKNLATMTREDMKDMAALIKDRVENAKTLNAVERMKLHRDITEARLNQFKKIIPHFETLYAGMSDEEKNKTDKILQTGRWEVQE